MKFIAMLILVLLAAAPCRAQEERVLIDGEIENGGFGGPGLKATRLNGERALLLGGRGGWIINHTFMIGGAGYGLVTNVRANLVDPIHKNIDCGYGGLDLEYIPFSGSLLHPSFAVLIGGGGVGYRDEAGDEFNRYHRMDGFFVLEPNAAIDLNVTHFFRLSAGVSYRIIAGLSSVVSRDADLSGPSALLTFKFGSF